jgi:hypothetical protein
MTDMNSQANRGGSTGGSKMPERKELTHDQFEHEKEKRERIEARTDRGASTQRRLHTRN